MTIYQKMKDLRAKVQALRKDEKLRESNALLGDCYFLNADEIVCYRRKAGDARYPYSADGLTLWAHASGNIGIEESTFNVIVGFPEGNEPNLGFFFGKKRKAGYFPVSLTGAAKQPDEKGVLRYTVYTPEAAYYFTEFSGVTACVRMFIDDLKNIRFTLAAINGGKRDIEGYLAAYFNCMISYTYEYHETKWYRAASVKENGFLVQMNECPDRLTRLIHYGRLYRDISNDRVHSTTSHIDFMGGMHNQLYDATPLKTGKFACGKKITRFSDKAIEGDILPLSLQAGGRFAVSYTLAISDDAEELERRAKLGSATGEIDERLYGAAEKNEVGKKIPAFQFEGFEIPQIQANAFSYFLKNVFRQNEFCARAKNYAGPLIGVRDIFQQLESALMWIPDYCRKKIVEALNYLGENGRAPRQYSYAPSKNVLPAMDLRPFIDQGVWIISTVYTYLCYTGDTSILKEECGYYRFDGDRVAGLSEKRDTVLDHLLCIGDYLLSNSDEETNCLHALYGDWNDALDGLGRTDDEGKAYGTGVSVMATLQFYKNLNELCEILRLEGREEKLARYQAAKERVKAGLLRYAVATNEKRERKILHGWGDKRSYFIGSYRDNDGCNRDSLTSDAFWVLSGALQWDESLKEDILKAYRRLDSKYGLKTFEPYFAVTNTKAGRIVNLPKGTAENGAVYIHATLFGIWSLFKMGEAKLAWEQLAKILPITHKIISTTPFVMPNSYCCNEEFGIDGESMSDWFTGSGCVLLKVLLWEIFGVQADLKGVRVKMPDYVPFKKGNITLFIRGAKLMISYEKTGEGRKYIVNGKSAETIRLEAETLKKGTFDIKIYD